MKYKKQNPPKEYFFKVMGFFLVSLIGTSILVSGGSVIIKNGGLNVSNSFFVDPATGNVGIGTTSSGYKLDVNGALRLQPASAPTGANGVVYYDSGTNKFRCYENGAWKDCIGGVLPSGTSGQTLRHNGTNWVANSVIFNNGTNVGIGTTTPGAKLQVAGSIKANNIGSVFTHWGSAAAPAGTTLLYSGYGFSEHYTQSGGSADATCIKSGDAGGVGPGANYGDLLYPLGTGDVARMPPGITAATEIKCAVSYVEGPSFEIWGTWTCPSGWTSLVAGYGMGAYYAHVHQSNRHCVDNVNYDASVASPNWGDIWYGTVMYDLTDLPGGNGYTANTYVKCAVCAKL